ncbi:gliding motility-associated C-terminal domain-containing protein [Brumimicrobium sp.]|uniref:T9SS type B sorting domain-containing protein n=1 Tax=Brumimicrobium sp. TaxID=2029867 RepID=UPI003A9101B8
MKNFYQNTLAFLLFLLSIFVFQQDAKASHVAGGYLQFECTGTPGQYLMRLILYRDCSGVNLGQGNLGVDFTNNCGGVPNRRFFASYVSHSEVSQVCVQQAGNTTCTGGNLPGYEEFIYEAIINLDDCDTWTASYSLCCRNGTNNLNGQPTFNITTQLNTATDDCNTSPVVTAQPEPYVCNGQPVSYNLGAYEPDGDSISYALVSATNNPTTPSNYSGGFSGTNPIAGVNIDPVTGTVTFTPTVNGPYVFVIQMTEYDSNGNVVTVTNYEYQTYVETCNNELPQPPSATPGGGVTNVTGSIVQTGPNSLTLCQGFQGCFDVVFTDPDPNDVLTVTSNLANVLPGATITETGTNPLTVSVCWTPVTTSGTVTLNFLVEDDACPITGQNNYGASINVVNPGVPSVTTTDETCGGTDEGTATITMSGGVAPFTYNISGPQNNTNTSGNFTNLPPGNYNYTVNTGGGCDVTGTFTINPGPPLPVTVNSTPLSCNGAADGTATATPTGGLAPYVYVWSQGGTPIGQNTQTASNLAAGTYDVSVTDDNGCVVVETVVVTEPDVLTGTITPTNTLCNGDATGQIDISGVTGGTPTYFYSLNNGTPQSGTNFSGLAAGNHQVEIIDDQGCSLVLTTVVGEPAVLNLVLDNVDDATCGANSGAIDVTASGGEGPYNYAIGGTTSSTGSFTNIAPGTHTVIVTDDNGCTATVTANVGAVATPTAFVDNLQDLSCFGGNNGEVIIGTSGALAPVSYSLDGGAGQASNTFSGLSAGNYSVEITDGNGCTASVSFTITQPPVLTYTTVATPASCAGNCDGEITITATGGTSPYEYSSNAGLSFGTNPTLTGLCAGNIQVVVEDNNGCLSNSTVTITEPTPLTATFVNTDPVCKDGSDGTIEVNAAGGTPTPGYQYSVNGGPLQPSNILTGLPAGNHDVTIQDGNGCEITSTQTLINPAGIDIDTLSMTPSNCGFNDGELVFTASGANPPFLYSLDGSPNQASGTFSNQLAGAYQIVVTDFLGCQDSTYFGINDIQMDGDLVGTVDVSCYGGSDGEVEVINYAGAAPITFELDNSGTTQTNGSFNGISAGNHIVTIYDAGYCVYTVPFTITQPDEIDFTANVQDVSCNGGATGEIEVINVTGGTTGTGLYQYSIDGGFVFQASNVFSGLTAGTYTVIVMDDNNCMNFKTFTIDEATPITFTTNEFDLNCNNDNTGLLQIVAAGGAGNYSYSIDNGATFQAGLTFTGLAAGTYDIVVEDGSGCQVNGTATLTEPAPLTANYLTTDADCFGVCDGEILITAAGGSTPYSYSIDNGTTLTTNNNITGICASTFDVVVKDDNGCLITSTETVNEPTEVTFTSAETPSTCSDPNGEITITASGGTIGYTYSIDNGATYVGGNNFTGLTAGTYDLMVLDNNGCPASGIQTVTDMASPSITMVTKTDPLCNGDANGEIVVTATGGTGTLSYTLNGGTPQASATITGVPAGTHTVTVTDLNGCTDTETVTLTEPDPLAFTSVPTDLTCFENSTGKINVTPSGGTPPYQYSFDNGVTFGASPSNNFIAAGTYDIVLRDYKGCEVMGTETVTQPTELLIDNVATTDALCNSSCDGEIQLTVSGGLTPYTYNWVQGVAGASDDLATGLCAGTYDFIVEDYNGCLVDSFAVVDEPDSVEITSIIKDDITCNGDCDGEIIVNSPTATEYSIDGGATFQAANVFNNLCAGDFDIIARDIDGCTVEATVNLWEALPMALTITDDTTVCHAYNYQVVGSASGGIQPYTFQWGNGGSVTDTLDIIATQTETYSLEVFDYNGCTVPAESMTVTVIPLVDILVLQDTTICPDGTATLTAQGIDGLPAYDYVWSNGETGAMISVSPSTTTTYTATVTDQCGDQASGDVVVDLHGLPTVLFEGDDLTGCVPHTVNFTNLTNAADVGANCIWTINGQTFTGCTDLEYTFNAEFCYDVSLQVESPFGCVSDTTFLDYVCVDGYPTAAFSFNPTHPTSVNNIVDFTNTSVGGETYNWSFEGEGTTNETNPRITFSNVNQATDITVCLEAISEYGCADEVCQDIEFKDEFAVYVPNTFTPDDDQHNPTFYPVFPTDSEIHDYHLIIFNRWGEVMFESYDYRVGWNGTYGVGSTEIVKDGTYVWKIKVTEGADNKQREFVGHVTLLR